MSEADRSDDRRDDPELVQSYLAGDVAAFGVLYRRHRDRVVRIATGIVPDREAALDVAQDVFIRLSGRLGDWRGDAAFTTWLHRITVNACLDRLRARADVAMADVPEQALAPTDETPDPVRVLDVRAALAAIDVDQRSAVVLHDMIGYSYDEIAAICGVPVGTIRSRLARGRAKLAQLLAEPGNDSGPSTRQTPDGST